MELESKVGDSFIVQEVREHNEDAKDYLYTKYSSLIHKEINAFKKKAYILGIDYQDLTQEAMLGFSNAIRNFSDESETKFITFATLCVRRRLSNYVAKFDNSKSKLFSDFIALDKVIGNDENQTLLERISAAPLSDPLKRMINEETLSELGKRMESLSDNEKLVFGYDLDGKTVDEIAELMGMKNKQVYNLIFRARQKMKV